MENGNPAQPLQKMIAREFLEFSDYRRFKSHDFCFFGVLFWKQGADLFILK
jgi:hypothetical protein